MGWRHALADTTNFDRGLQPVTDGPVLDLAALRDVTPYGLVAMACLVAHNDRLLASTSIVPPCDPSSTARLMAAGFGYVVREFLCPVVGGVPLPLPPEPGGTVPALGEGTGRLALVPDDSGLASSAPSLEPMVGGGNVALVAARQVQGAECSSVAGTRAPLAYGPLASVRRRLPVAAPPVLALRPVHDAVEATVAADELARRLMGDATVERITVVAEALVALADNRRHAGTFDAYVAAALVEDPGRGRCIELAVGDSGVGLRAAVTEARTATAVGQAAGRSAVDEPVAASVAEPVDEPVDDAAAVDRVLDPSTTTGLARLARQVAEVGGVTVVRSGSARHTVCATGTVRATVPWVRGTVVAVSVPTAVPPVPQPPTDHGTTGRSEPSTAPWPGDDPAR
jgi:hypothetical protein